jgi:hypothetical protein
MKKTRRKVWKNKKYRKAQFYAFYKPYKYSRVVEFHKIVLPGMWSDTYTDMYESFVDAKKDGWTEV